MMKHNQKQRLENKDLSGDIKNRTLKMHMQTAKTIKYSDENGDFLSRNWIM